MVQGLGLCLGFMVRVLGFMVQGFLNTYLIRSPATAQKSPKAQGL